VPRRGVIAGAVAFDTGPGVAVIDAVTRRVDPDAPYDQDGERARRGHPDLKALHQLLTDPFFDQPPPKSTGRERFGIEFADRLIALVRGAGGSANDAVATATALTAETVARGIERWTPPPSPPPGAAHELVISGGGARNPALVELLAARVGGFIIFGGTRDAVGALTRDLRQGAGRPLLIGADLERGVAQQVQGMTELPPAAALGFLDDLEATRTAGVITGAEGRTLG